MDAQISATARALAVGDPLTALNRLGLRDDPPALALRGIAMAQLGEFDSARGLLRRARSRFSAREALARARCVVAEAEVELAMRDLRTSTRSLSNAAALLEARGDRANAMQAGLLAVRRRLLLGRVEEAAAALEAIQPRTLPAALRAVAELAAAEVAIRRLRILPARRALDRARKAALVARIPALLNEVGEAARALDRPAARRVVRGTETSIRLDEVERLCESGALIVDGCRRAAWAGAIRTSLDRRPVLFDLLRHLAEGSPEFVPRLVLIERAFGARRPNESHRARLRVEIGRLRRLLAPLTRIEAGGHGYRLVPSDGGDVVLLLPPIDGANASILALLADGAAWTTSALALALGSSQRTVQRSLGELVRADQVRSIGRGRARRWLARPLVGITTHLLLPVPRSLA